jgi:tetratricopeptide (TPR) repeat protein
MSQQRSLIGASLAAAALFAFGFAPNAFGAGGGGQNDGGGHSGGSGFSGSGFSGSGFNSGGFSGGHAGGGLQGGGFARPPVGGHSGVSPALTPSGGGHLSPGSTGGSQSSVPTRPIGPQNNPAWQQGMGHWTGGQYWGSHWAGFGFGNVYGYPYYFAFVPFLYGSYGYLYPYYYYGSPYAYYPAYYPGDDSPPPVNLPAANIGPPIDAGANAPIQNGVAPNAGLLAGAAVNAAPPNAAGAAAGADGEADGSAGAEFFIQAEAAFHDGRYRDALRLANHAAVESPRNPKAHELMSLSLFALADYRGAAIEAHAAVALGPIADWATIFGYYGDQVRYTTQLRALEKYSRENPKSAEARFLRAYHYLMTGHIDSAKEQLAEAIQLTPSDKLAADLLKKYNGDGAAAQPAAAPKPPPAAPAKPANPDPGFDT